MHWKELQNISSVSFDISDEEEMGLIVSESDYEPSEADTDSDAFVTLEERLGASDSE